MFDADPADDVDVGSRMTMTMMLKMKMKDMILRMLIREKLMMKVTTMVIVIFR